MGDRLCGSPNLKLAASALPVFPHERGDVSDDHCRDDRDQNPNAIERMRHDGARLAAVSWRGNRSSLSRAPAAIAIKLEIAASSEA
jgi:hypothetical protein